jgi:hypothetical protein
VTRAIGVGVFVALIAIGVCVEMLARRRSDRYVTLADAVDWLRARRSGRLLLFAGWAFTGWHFFVRR